MTETKKKGFPWMPMYVDDLLRMAAGLTVEQFGALLRLKAHAWAAEAPCTLPDSDARLSALSGLNGTWDANKAALLEHFVPDGSGRLVDPTLLARWREQLAKHESYAKRGLAGRRTQLGLNPGLAPTHLSSLVGKENLEQPGPSPAPAQPQPSKEVVDEWLRDHPGQRIPIHIT